MRREKARKEKKNGRVRSAERKRGNVKRRHGSKEKKRKLRKEEATNITEISQAPTMVCTILQFT